MADIAKINFSRQRPQDLNRLVEEGLRQGIFPGMELLVARGETVLLHEAWGHLERAPEAEPLHTGTLWDLASLTKPVATATCLLLLLERGLVGLEDRVVHYFPEFDSPEKAGITLRHLLTHTSGLPDWVDLFSTCKTPAEALQRVLHLPLHHPTGTAMLYSDVGYFILAELIRRVSGQRLRDFFAQQVAHPLGLRHSAFNPLETDLGLPIAPTQYCVWRKQLLRGVVHDENAHVFGGEGGNAGLFSTGADLHRYVCMLLNGGELDGVRVLNPRTVQVMLANHNPRRLPPRAIGWDVKGETPGYTSCGELMHRGALGHTGFTGTSLWFEPDTGFLVILLSNRVNLSREKNQRDMVRFRPRLHNLVVTLFEEG